MVACVIVYRSKQIKRIQTSVSRQMFVSYNEIVLGRSFENMGHAGTVTIVN